MTGRDLDVPEVDPCVEHGRDKSVAEHMRVCPGYLDVGSPGELVQAPGGCVPVHPGIAAIEQDRSARAGSGCPVDGPTDGGRQRDQDNLGALTAYAQHPVTMLFAEIADVRSSGLEYPQAEQPEHGHQREVARVRRLPGGGEHGLELQVSKPERR